MRRGIAFCSLVRQPDITATCSLETLLQDAAVELALVVVKLAQDTPQPFHGTDGRSISAEQAQ